MAADQTPPNPWTRPGFIAAGVVVGLVLILAIVLAVMALNRDADPDPVATPTPSETSSQAPSATPTPTATATAAAVEESVCGLDGVELAGDLTTAPEAQWQYQGTTAYPTSPEFGPAETTEEGVRYCFQHSPEGALLAAANAAVQGSDPERVGQWLDYFVAEGPHRTAVINAGDGDAESAGSRVDIAGFRLLNYDGEAATVDLALRGSSGGQQVYLSMVYDLVWQDGDWKLSVNDPAAPVDVAQLPDLAGYVTWGS